MFQFCFCHFFIFEFYHFTIFKITSKRIELERCGLRRQLVNLKGYIYVTNFFMICWVSLELFGAKPNKTRDQENCEKGLELHHSTLSREALQIASPMNGGCNSVNGSAYLIYMDLQLICIHFYFNKLTCDTGWNLFFWKIVMSWDPVWRKKRVGEQTWASMSKHEQVC